MLGLLVDAIWEYLFRILLKLSSDLSNDDDTELGGVGRSRDVALLGKGWNEDAPALKLREDDKDELGTDFCDRNDKSEVSLKPIGDGGGGALLDGRPATRVSIDFDAIGAVDMDIALVPEIVPELVPGGL